MQAKKKHPGLSKKQLHADRRNAAAGRAAEAKARAKPGFKPSKAQHKQSVHAAKLGRQSQARARRRKAEGLQPLKPKLSEGDVACCAAEAAAASLRLHGAHVTEEDMLRLYWSVAADPDDGALLEDLLRPGMALAGWYLSSTNQIQPASNTHYTPGTILAWDSWDGLEPARRLLRRPRRHHLGRAVRHARRARRGVGCQLVPKVTLYEDLLRQLPCGRVPDGTRWIMSPYWYCECRRESGYDGHALWQPPLPPRPPDMLFGIPVEVRDDGGKPHLESIGNVGPDGWAPMTGRRSLP